MDTVTIEALDVNSYDRQQVFTLLQEGVTQLSCRVLSQFINEALDGEVTKRLQRPRRAPRADSGQAQLPWRCHRCGTTLARDFQRDGHYRRGLQTTLGSLNEIRVPMLECQQCGAAADIEFAALRKHKQLWLDIQQEAVFCYGVNEGMRHIAQQVARQLGWPVSASSIQSRLHELTEQVARWRDRPVTPVPDVLMIDGLWFTIREPTGGYETDVRGRQRPQKQKSKRVAIVVLGLWSDSGRKQILDFMIAEGESEQACVELLNRLHLRGVTEAQVKLIVSDGAGGICAAIETVYPTVARQRCIFHKLRNIAQAVVADERRAQILQEASWIYQADSCQQAHQRREQFSQNWQQAEPEAVQTLGRDFAASLAYLGNLPVSSPRRYRTTNAMEGGVMCQLRTKVRQATAFGSTVGAQAALFVTIKRLNAHQRNVPWIQQTNQLLPNLNTKP